MNQGNLSNENGAHDLNEKNLERVCKEIREKHPDVALSVIEAARRREKKDKENKLLDGLGKVEMERAFEDYCAKQLEWNAEKALYHALHQLVELKNYRERSGKDLYYRERKYDAWMEARAVLERYDEQRAKSEG